MYQLTISYDGKKISSHTFGDAISAVETFQKCVDVGDAKEYAVYNLLEPNGKMHTRWYSRDGKAGGK